MAAAVAASEYDPTVGASERKRELEKLLERDLDEVNFFEETMAKTQRLTTKMVIMLDSVDARLDKLQDSIVPIHGSTQKMSRTHENIDKTLSLVEMTIGFFDRASKENNMVMKGPDEQNIEAYLTTVQNVIEALKYLNEFNYKAGERGISELRGILKIAVMQLTDLMKRWLKGACSSTLTKFPTAETEIEAVYAIPDQTIQSLIAVTAKLSQALQTLQECLLNNYDNRTSIAGTAAPLKDGSGGGGGGGGVNTGGAGGRLAGFVTKVDEFSVHTTAYIDIRSQHLVKIFSVLANACTGIQTTTSGGGGGNGAAAANNNNNAKQGVINTSTTTTASTSAGGDLATAISGYQKGSGKILAFTRALFKALKHERELVTKLFPKALAQLTFQSVVGPLISLYIETCEYILGRAKKAAAIVSSDDNKESGGGGVKGGDGGNPQSTTAGGGTSMPGGAGGIISFLVLDLIECMVQSRTEYDGVVVYSGAKGIELTEAVTRLKSASGFFFKEFFDDLKPDVANAKNATLPPDGTVHEITSKTLNTIKKMIDYHFIIDTILAEGWGVQASFPISSFSSMCSESIDQLVLNLESRSRLYISKHKTPTLAPIFLMNNFQYCLKQFGKDRRLADLLDGTGNFAVSGGGGTRRVSTAGTTTSAVGIQSSPTTPGRTEEKFTKMVKSQKELYLNSWKHMYDYLMDSTYIQNGVMVKTLSKQQRDVVKDKFKVERLGFNTDFEDMLKAQKSYSIPDAELRSLLLNDIKSVLLVLYSRFWDRYQNTEFSKNAEKYMKYDMETLGEMLHEFFSSTG